jgi:hypothetical protein
MIKKIFLFQLRLFGMDDPDLDLQVNLEKKEERKTLSKFNCLKWKLSRSKTLFAQKSEVAKYVIQ